MRTLLPPLVLLFAACPAPSTTTLDATSVAADLGGRDLAGVVGCGGARVVIAFFDDAACTSMKGMRAYDTSLDCFSWTATGSSAAENSATRFQCYQDRLCYTQHPNSLTCGDGGFGRTDKQAKLGVCLKEPDGSLYSKLLSGAESCPAAPQGFECPTSASMAGTDGIVACTTQ